MYEKESLENKVPQKGVVSEEEGCVMNMRDLCHEYEGHVS